jgi:hypothetical protein
MGLSKPPPLTKTLISKTSRQPEQQHVPPSNAFSRARGKACNKIGLLYSKYSK